MRYLIEGKDGEHVYVGKDDKRRRVGKVRNGLLVPRFELTADEEKELITAGFTKEVTSGGPADSPPDNPGKKPRVRRKGSDD